MSRLPLFLLLPLLQLSWRRSCGGLRPFDLYTRLPVVPRRGRAAGPLVVCSACLQLNSTCSLTSTWRSTTPALPPSSPTCRAVVRGASLGACTPALALRGSQPARNRLCWRLRRWAAQCCMPVALSSGCAGCRLNAARLLCRQGRAQGRHGTWAAVCWLACMLSMHPATWSHRQLAGRRKGLLTASATSC